MGDLAHPWAPRAFGRLRRGQPERFRLIALSAVLAVPASAASSYQVLVAGIDTSADPAQAAVKVRELPGGTPNTIDLGGWRPTGLRRRRARLGDRSVRHRGNRRLHLG